MGSYVPSTLQQREEMLKVVGLSSLEELYRDVPASIRIDGKEAAPGPDRYRMVELAIKDEAGWSASNMELVRSGVSYTYDTIVVLKERYGAAYDLFFIIGADSAVELAQWYRIKEALALCTFVVATRPGFGDQVELVKESLQASELTNLVWVKTPEIAISSTEIRNKIKENLPIEGLMPPAVVEYIRQRDLYQ